MVVLFPNGEVCTSWPDEIFGDSLAQKILVYSKTPQHRQKCNEKGELLLNAFVFFHIAEKVLSFSSLSPASVLCLILLSFLEIPE
jgi:hypothetical protein